MKIFYRNALIYYLYNNKKHKMKQMNFQIYYLKKIKML